MLTITYSLHDTTVTYWLACLFPPSFLRRPPLVCTQSRSAVSCWHNMQEAKLGDSLLLQRLQLKLPVGHFPVWHPLQVMSWLSYIALHCFQQPCQTLLVYTQAIFIMHHVLCSSPHQAVCCGVNRYYRTLFIWFFCKLCFFIYQQVYLCLMFFWGVLGRLFYRIIIKNFLKLKRSQVEHAPPSGRIYLGFTWRYYWLCLRLFIYSSLLYSNTVPQCYLQNW